MDLPEEGPYTLSATPHPHAIDTFTCYMYVVETPRGEYWRSGYFFPFTYRSLRLSFTDFSNGLNRYSMMRR